MASLNRGKANKKSVEADDEKETNAAMKKRLEVEIRSLKLLITQVESQLNLTTFGDLCLDKESPALETTKPDDYRKLKNVEALFQNDLCRFAGFRCRKMDDKLLIAFQSLRKNWYTSDYWIQLFNNEEGWHLGSWMMPISIDVRAIFNGYSMSTSANMKVFITVCKHLVDCHNRRQQQYKRLEVFMNHMQRYGCSLEVNFGYTNVTMKLLMKKLETSSNDVQTLIVYLLSANDTVLINKISIDCEGDNELPKKSRKDFTKMFNCFKEMDWVDAARQTLASPDSPFVWKDASNNDSVIEINDDEGNDVDTSFSRLLKNQSKGTKKRRSVKSGILDENSNDAREKDLNIEVIDVPDDVAPAQVVARKSTKQKHETTKKTEPDKEIFLRKIIAPAVLKDRGSTRATQIPEKLKTPRASRKENLHLKDRNQNVMSSYLKNPPIETAEKPSKITDKRILDASKILKLKQRTNNAAPTGDQKSAEKRKAVVDAEEPGSIMKKSRSNGVVSSSTPKVRSGKMLLCSTPKNEGLSALSTIAEENISAIPQENSINSRRTVDAEQTERTINKRQSIDDDSDDANEKDLSAVCNDYDGLLKDLQAVWYDNSTNGKAKPTKPLKRNIKAPSRGRKKVSKK